MIKLNLNSKCWPNLLHISRWRCLSVSKSDITLSRIHLILICFKSRGGCFPKLSVWESLKSREHNPRSTNKHVAYLRCSWRLGQCNKSPMNAPVHRMMNVLTVAERFNKTHQRSDFCTGSLTWSTSFKHLITICLRPVTPNVVCPSVS